MNVLSLFDGISCGMLALKRAGVTVNNYFASEIDKDAILVSRTNFPSIIQLGDIRNIDSNIILKLPKIDLLIGGSPCQSFSNAGDRSGFDGKSGLFYEYLRILREVKPTYFLLENVKMKKCWADIISKELGVEPIEIDSSVVSAQQRKRLYWTNIDLGKLEYVDKNLVIADVLGLVCNDKQKKIVMSKSEFDVRVRKNYVNKDLLSRYLRSHKRLTGLTNDDIASALAEPVTKVEHWFRTDSSFSIPDDNLWLHLKAVLNISGCEFDKCVMEFETKRATFDMSKRIYHVCGKHPTLTTLTGGGQRKTITDGVDLFYLEPCHAEMLQTLPVGYTEGISKNKRFAVIGNGWTVDVLAGIFKQLSGSPGELGLLEDQ